MVNAWRESEFGDSFDDIETESDPPRNRQIVQGLDLRETDPDRKGGR